jgi:hypothetical protein
LGQSSCSDLCFWKVSFDYFFLLPGANPTTSEFTTTAPAGTFFKVEESIFVSKRSM